MYSVVTPKKIAAKERVGFCLAMHNIKVLKPLCQDKNHVFDSATTEKSATSKSRRTFPPAVSSTAQQSNNNQ
jgi:hypothetical protein